MAFDGPGFVRHIAERLIQEFRFSQGAGTPGLVGAAKEHPARVQLEKLLPGGVKVGSGIVVDSYGGVSKQQDIVIYESLCPVFTHNGAAEATYYPVEGVIAVGEVKSGLGKKELLDAVEKAASVKSLKRRAIAEDDGLGEPTVAYRTYGSVVSFAGTIEEQFNQDTKPLDQVFSFVLGERMESSPQTTLANFAAAVSRTGLPNAPNMVVSLNDGAIMPFDARNRTTGLAIFQSGGLMFTADPLAGFAELVGRLRRYSMSGRTVDRGHFERYFRPFDEKPQTFTINAAMTFDG